MLTTALAARAKPLSPRSLLGTSSFCRILWGHFSYFLFISQSLVVFFCKVLVGLEERERLRYNYFLASFGALLVLLDLI